ncbi:MAG: hypothetical protein AB7F40_08160 [Victivallaceae bacterium]|nr:hypothetical protein [Victivallaceae bacterium]
MKRIFCWLAAAIAAVMAVGCATSEPPDKFVGRYSSPETPWFLKLDREGNIEFSFSDNSPGDGNRMIVRGYCDFAVDDPQRPVVYPQLDAMRGKFQLVWSEDGSRLVVMLMLSDNSEMVMRHGRQVLLYKEKSASGN